MLRLCVKLIFDWFLDSKVCFGDFRLGRNYAVSAAMVASTNRCGKKTHNARVQGSETGVGIDSRQNITRNQTLDFTLKLSSSEKFNGSFLSKRSFIVFFLYGFF